MLRRYFRFAKIISKEVIHMSSEIHLISNQPLGLNQITGEIL